MQAARRREGPRRKRRPDWRPFRRACVRNRQRYSQLGPMSIRARRRSRHQRPDAIRVRPPQRRRPKRAVRPTARPPAASDCYSSLPWFPLPSSAVCLRAPAYCVFPPTTQLSLPVQPTPSLLSSPPHQLSLRLCVPQPILACARASAPLPTCGRKKHKARLRVFTAAASCVCNAHLSHALLLLRLLHGRGAAGLPTTLEPSSACCARCVEHEAGPSAVIGLRLPHSSCPVQPQR